MEYIACLAEAQFELLKKTFGIDEEIRIAIDCKSIRSTSILCYEIIIKCLTKIDFAILNGFV